MIVNITEPFAVFESLMDDKWEKIQLFEVVVCFFLFFLRAGKPKLMR